MSQKTTPRDFVRRVVRHSSLQPFYATVIEPRVIGDALSAVSVGDAFEIYKRWCEAAGLICGRQMEFVAYLRDERDVAIARKRVLSHGKVTNPVSVLLFRPISFGPVNERNDLGFLVDDGAMQLENMAASTC